MTLDLVSLFETVPALGEADRDQSRLSAIPIPDYDRHRLGRGREDAPALLIASRDRDYQSYTAPILLEHLSIQYDVTCRIRRADGGEESSPFTVVTCTDVDQGLRSYFLRVAGMIVATVGSHPSRQTIATSLEALVELFRTLAMPSRKSVQGLWAELFIIDRSESPQHVAAAWHAMPEDRFDFAHEGERVEVKSASTRTRRHHFSLDQLGAIADTRVAIASLFVERNGGGVTVGTLLDSIRSRLSGRPDLALKVEVLAASTLGSTFRRALHDAFDAQLAADSLLFFSPSDIPAVSGVVPSAVSDVHFQSDLSEVMPIVLERAGDESLFRAMPRSGRLG